MDTPRQANFAVTNRLLAALPRAVFERLALHLHRDKLAKGKMLYNAGDELREAYFIQSGVVSYISSVATDEESAAGVVGDEGVVGIPSSLRYRRAVFRVIVQIEGEALRVDGEFLRRECEKGGELQHLILCHAHTIVSQFAQAIVCNRFHTVEKRLARFLLMVHDRAPLDTLHLTHEFLASMLGTSRTDVTEAAGALQNAGLIRYRRGAMTILDKAGLRAATCVCYHILLEEYEHFINA